MKLKHIYGRMVNVNTTRLTAVAKNLRSRIFIDVLDLCLVCVGGQRTADA